MQGALSASDCAAGRLSGATEDARGRVTSLTFHPNLLVRDILILFASHSHLFGEREVSDS